MPQRPAHLSVIIVALNCWEATQACLYSLQRHTPAGLFEVLLVDNASTDATPLEAQALGEALFPRRFSYLRQEINRNFGPGCSLGAQQAQGELLLFLNNDTEVTAGWHTPLLQAAKSLPRWGALSPLLVYPPGSRAASSVQHLGVAFAPDLALSHLYRRFPASHPVVTRERRLQALTGAALLTPRALFLDCGGFHPGYVNGYEDLDLCCQLRRRGRSLHCVPQSVVFHHEGLTPGRLEHDAHNAALLMQRCAGCFSPDLHRLATEDGFAVELTRWLALQLHLTAQQERELARTCDAASPEALRKALEREPLWKQGREQLLSMEQNGDERFRLLEEFCFFHPDAARLQQLQTLAQARQDQAVAQHAALRLEGIRSRLQDAEALQRKAQALGDWARKAGDEALECLFANWLEEHAV